MIIPTPLRLSKALIFLLILAVPLSSYAQTIAPERVLVRNVRLIDPSGDAEDKIVNILIREGELEVVTEDKISRDEADMVVNANEGVLVGKLNVGEQPSFLIFSEDPRDNFEVMLDTHTYATFAVHNGEVVKNRLLDMLFDDPEDEPKKSGWLAYTPPPLMVPMDYQDTTKWNRWESKYVSGIFVSAVVIDRMFWLSQNDVSDAQFGDLKEFDGGEIRGFRFGVVGTLNFEIPWVYTFFAATNAFDKGFETVDLDDFTIFDYRLDIPFFKNSVMSIGKQKEPISLERLTGGTFLPNQERAAVSDALLPSRNVGIVWNGSSPGKYSSWAIGAFNDWFDAGEDFNESSSQYVGRITWAPMVSEDESNLVHLGAGYRYSNAKQGFQYRTEPEFNKSPLFVDTGGPHPADKTETFNLEFAWRKGPFTLSSEYTQVDVKNPELENPTFKGYYVTAAWILTGEMRPYYKKSGVFGGIPVAKTVYQHGKGAWELYTRYSDIDLHDGRIDGGEMQIATLGLNWWLTPFFTVNVGYRYIWNEQYGLERTSSGFLSRFILVLE